MSINKDYGVYVEVDGIVLPTKAIHDEPLTFHEAKRLRDKHNSSLKTKYNRAVIRPLSILSGLMPPNTQFSVLILRLFVRANPNATAEYYNKKMNRKATWK